MSERLATDANAVIDLFRTGTRPPPITKARTIYLPLPVIGELFAGAYISERRDANLALIDDLIDKWKTLVPDVRTARVHGQVRAKLGDMPRTSQSRINDLWIAALCIQHNLPLLTTDHGFDTIPGLTVLHW